MLQAVTEVSHLFRMTYYKIRMKIRRKQKVRSDYNHATPVSILDWQCT